MISSGHERDPYEPDEADKKEICLLPADAGPCGESHARWFYEPSSFTCLPFVYGGCGGNKNRFKSSEVINESEMVMHVQYSAIIEMRF